MKLFERFVFIVLTTFQWKYSCNGQQDVCKDAESGLKYSVINEVIGRKGAIDKCTKLGGELAIMETQHKFDFIGKFTLRLKSKFSHSEFWIGGAETSATSDIFKWSNGDVIDNNSDNWDTANENPRLKNNDQLFVLFRVKSETYKWRDSGYNEDKDRPRKLVICQSKDPCTSCQNGGTCYTPQGMCAYACNCLNGYIGSKCENRPPQLTTYKAPKVEFPPTFPRTYSCSFWGIPRPYAYWRVNGNTSSVSAMTSNNYNITTTLTLQQAPCIGLLDIKCIGYRTFSSGLYKTDEHIFNENFIYDAIVNLSSSSEACNGTSGIITWKSDVPSYFNVLYQLTNVTKNISTNSYKYTNLQSRTEYDIKMIATVETACSKSPFRRQVSTKLVTKEGPPSAVNKFQVSNSKSNQLQCDLTWKWPSKPRIPYRTDITSFTVKAVGEINVVKEDLKALYKNDERYFEISNLDVNEDIINWSNEFLPNRKYSFHIWATTCAGNGTKGLSFTQCITLPNVPSFIEPPSIDNGMISDEGMLKTRLHFLSEEFGPIRCVGIVVSAGEVNELQQISTHVNLSEFLAANDAWIAFVGKNKINVVSILLGDEKEFLCDIFDPVFDESNSSTQTKLKASNRKLNPEQTYSIRSFAASVLLDGDVTITQSTAITITPPCAQQPPWLIAIIAVAVVLLIIITGSLLYKKCKQDNNEVQQQELDIQVHVYNEMDRSQADGNRRNNDTIPQHSIGSSGVHVYNEIDGSQADSNRRNNQTIAQPSIGSSGGYET